MTTFVLSPSDFTFLYEGCKRCFYDKYVLNLKRPRYSMPGIFTLIDEKMTSWFDNKPTSVISPELPDGIVTLGQLRVRSKPIPCADYDCEIIIEGRVDSLLRFNNEAQEMGILDFKVTQPKPYSVPLYRNQLMGYSVALEHNDPEFTKTCKITHLGLCCFSPNAFNQLENDFGVTGDLIWLPMEKDTKAFKAFLREVAAVLMGTRPESGERCEFCNYAKYYAH